MAPNPSKCYLICGANAQVSSNIESEVIKNSKCRKPLAVSFTNRLLFKTHADDICMKTGRNLNTLSNLNTLIPYMYLVWLCHNRTINNEISYLH